MANEGSTGFEIAVSRIIRFIVGLLMPAWGIIMVVIGAMNAQGWWIATGAVVLVIGVVLFAGSALVTPFLGGR